MIGNTTNGLKAFGYSDLTIGWHYLKFALSAAVLAIAMVRWVMKLDMVRVLKVHGRWGKQ